MNIWIINQHAKLPGGAGSTRHATIAKHLSEFGHDVTVFTSSPVMEGFRFPKNANYVDQTFNGFTFRIVKIPQYRNVYHRFLCMVYFRRNVVRVSTDLRKPDVIIGSSVHLHAADAGRILAKKYKVPFLFEIRDIWPQTLVDIGALSKINPIYRYLRFIELRLLRDAKKIITLLPGSIKYLNENGVSKDKILYFPNGIDANTYPQETTRQKNNRKFTVMFFGAHGPANDLETLLDAASIIKSQNNNNIEIQLIGKGVSKKQLVNIAKEKGLSNVVFKDSLPKKKLFQTATEASCYVFTLKDMKVLELYGISSNKLFDYMMLGRPVVFSCNSFNNPIKEANAGISVNPGSPEALAEAIVKLSQTNHEKLVELGENGRRWVKQHHDLKKLLITLEKEIKKLINDGNCI